MLCSRLELVSCHRLPTEINKLLHLHCRRCAVAMVAIHRRLGERLPF
jgi:hypothetical protein